MDRDDIATLERAFRVLDRMGGLRLADDLAHGLLALLDVAQLVGMIEDSPTAPAHDRRGDSPFDGDGVMAPSPGTNPERKTPNSMSWARRR